MGEQGVCGGTAALPKPTGICGTSHRQGKALPYPAQKLPVAHQQQSGTGGRWKLYGEDGSSDKPTPVTLENDALAANCLIESQLRGMPHSPSKQHESFDPGSTALTSKDATDGGLQADNNAPGERRKKRARWRRKAVQRKYLDEQALEFTLLQCTWTPLFQQDIGLVEPSLLLGRGF